MAVLQLTLTKAVYQNPDKLEAAIEELRRVGAFAELDTTYAQRIGVLSGRLPDERVDDVRGLTCVSATMLSEIYHALDRQARSEGGDQFPSEAGLATDPSLPAGSQ